MTGFFVVTPKHTIIMRANFNWRHAVLIAVFGVAALLLFCELSENGTFFALVVSKAAGMALFGLGGWLFGKWRGHLGIDDILKDD